jgi:hypothetical protein
MFNSLCDSRGSVPTQNAVVAGAHGGTDAAKLEAYRRQAMDKLKALRRSCGFSVVLPLLSCVLDLGTTGPVR